MADSKHAPHPNADVVAEGGRACPICGATMTTESHGNISIDQCEKHGVWLDCGELEKIVSKAKGLSRLDGRLAARKAKTQGKYEGMIFGWLSLLWE